MIFHFCKNKIPLDSYFTHEYKNNYSDIFKVFSKMLNRNQYFHVPISETEKEPNFGLV